MKRTGARALIGSAAVAALCALPLAAHADGATPTPAGTSASAPTSEAPTPPARATPEPEAPAPAEATSADPEQGGVSPAETEPTPGATARTGTPTGANVVTLDLYNLTDVHGHIEKATTKDRKTGAITVKESGVAAVGCYLDRARATNQNSSFTLLGDNIGASPFTSGSLKDNPTIASLNLLDPLASTIGNHELDLGQEVFKQRVDGSNAAEYVRVGFPYLGANVQGMGSYEDPVTKETLPYLGDYKLWQSPSGVKVAFIGAIAEDVPYKLSPGTTKGLTFTDPIARINALASRLKATREADLVIAMLDDDVKNNYPKVGADVDGLMGGDTHVPYEFDHVDSAVRLESANPKLAGIASGSYTDNLGVISISYDPASRRVVSADSKLIPAGEVASCDSSASPTARKIDAVVGKAVADSKAAGEKVVATGVAGPFRRGVFTDAAGKTDPGSNRGIESSLGDLVADSMRETITTQDGRKVDIGVINAGGLREDLVPVDGKVTYAQTFAVMPFSNELGYVSITGADFRKALEQQWKTDLNSQNSRPMLKLGLSSNVRYTYDPTRPYGQRITSVSVDGKPLDDRRVYTVGSVTFLLAGGDSFDALTAAGPYKTSGNLDRDKFNEYLASFAASGKTVEPRAAKSSVGVTLGSETVENGSSVKVALRGLSFSEGPFATPTVAVRIGGETVTADVDNSLREPNASSTDSVVTTDGAGTATLTVPVAAHCPAQGGTVRVPVQVSTAFAEVVSADQGLSVAVACPAAKGQAPSPGASPDDRGGKDPGGATGKHPGAAGSAKAADRPRLARTGVDVGEWIALSAFLVFGGASAAVTARRKRCEVRS